MIKTIFLSNAQWFNLKRKIQTDYNYSNSKINRLGFRLARAEVRFGFTYVFKLTFEELSNYTFFLIKYDEYLYLRENPKQVWYQITDVAERKILDNDFTLDFKPIKVV